MYTQTNLPNSTKEKKSDRDFLDHKKLLSHGVFFVLLAIVFFWVGQLIVTPFFSKLPKDFKYSARILSLDNFYDESNNVFLGENRSVTTFSYRGEDVGGGLSLVRNIFDVRTVTGEKIIAIERDYGIDRRAWKHISGDLVDRDRDGYLFAPKGVNKEDAFTYWHVSYDLPVEMKFSHEENISGLKTYVFHSDFGVDQTDDLSHLPGVPEERGISLDVSLSLWIEPVSGWLVKYEDNTIAYYYDIETKERLNPWNKFSNRYIKSSIVSQAEEANRLKWKIIFLNYSTSLLILLAGLTFIWFRLVPYKLRTLKLKGIISITIILIVFVGWLYVDIRPNDKNIIIGISKWVPVGNDSYDENVKGFLESLALAGFVDGKNLETIIESANTNPDRQIEIAREFTTKNVDIVYSLTTPGTQILKDSITNKPIIFSVVTYPVEVGLIKSLQNSGNNLVGTRNWVPIEEQLRVFLEIVPNISNIAFLHRKGEKNSKIQLEEMLSAADSLGIDIISISGDNTTDILSRLQSIGKPDSIFSSCDTLIQAEAEKDIIEFAITNKIPSFSCNTSGPLNGDLVGTVADFYQIGRLAGEKALLVLEGAPPASLTTNTVTRPFVYVNQKTANLLGITIPQTILSEAEIIIR